MSDIFREVDEEVRQQQIIEFIKRYGKYVVAVVVLAIIVFAAMRYFDEQKRVEREAAGDRFAAAMTLLENERVTDAITAFGAAAEESGDEGYGLLARFRQAQALVTAGESEAAIDAYDAIMEDGSVDSVWRKLAGVYAATLALQAADNADVAQRLEALGGDHPWRLSVLELTALNQYRAGNADAAKETYRQVFDEAPAGSGFRGRSAQMLSVLGVPTSELTAE
ncbi:MAG: tetratricopeptide repeat protein [Alphaproteobacteria bacterium]